MEQYYLLVIVCCLLPLIVGGIWFAKHNRKPTHRKETQIKESAVSQKVGSLMLKEYHYRNVVLADSSNSLLFKLRKVNVYNPRTRETDDMDDWFKKVTPQLMHDGHCLAYIDSYGYLEDAFWLNIKKLNLKPEEDKKFQQLLFSVYKTSYDYWYRNFCNLPFHFGKYYNLLPEIELILNTDARFKDLKRTYEHARECAEEKKLKTIC